MLRRRIPSPCVRNHKITRPRCFVCSYCLVCQTVGNQTSTGAAVKNKVAFRNPYSLHCARSPAQPKQNFRQLSQTSRRALGLARSHQRDLFADVTCHLEMFSLFICSFEAASRIEAKVQAVRKPPGRKALKAQNLSRFVARV